jgi:competence protein ComEA
MRFERAFAAAVLFWLAAALHSAGGQSIVDPSTLPEGEGRAVLFKACAECHGPETVTAQRRTRAEWQGVVEDMVGRGAQASEDEIKALVTFLSINVGRVNVNRASDDELKAVVGLTADEAAAIVAYRTKEGVFKTLEDLKKVPGVDGNKLDERKDRIVFAGQ